jgi:glycosyltransferase involved in cell wall biosynthesis
MQLSFIIIGKNEAKNLNMCFNSVFSFIKFNNILKYEIIYVDSDSIDNSIEIAKSFKIIKIIKLDGEVNAAIARNEGARISKGKYLYFIDGDMEIMPNFYSQVFNHLGDLNYNFVSGEFLSYFYVNGLLNSIEPYHKIKKDIYENITGGIFIINRIFWIEMNGMNEKYRRCQDLDFGLRMSRFGFPLFRKIEIIAIHHTISYYDSQRLWKDLFNFNQLYQKSVLFRDHFFNPFIWRYIFREISLFSFFISIILFSLLQNPYFSLFFPFTLILKSIYKSKNGVSNSFIERYVYYLLLDLSTFFGLIFFWPSRKKKYGIKLILS